jgi:hypothetical protein
MPIDNLYSYHVYVPNLIIHDHKLSQNQPPQAGKKTKGVWEGLAKRPKKCAARWTPASARAKVGGVHSALRKKEGTTPSKRQEMSQNRCEIPVEESSRSRSPAA